MDNSPCKDNHHPCCLLPGTAEYPPVLQRCFDQDPPTVVTTGKPGLLNKTLVGFFCSVRSPGDIILKTYDLARTLRRVDVTIISGFQSPMEKESLSFLLRGTIAVVICPARGLGRMRVPAEWKKPLVDGRLLLLSFFDDDIRRPTTVTATKRNNHVVTLADRLLIAHAEKGGKIEELCKNALTRGKPVYTLASPDNTHLVKLGALPVDADNPESLIR